jgi:acyl-[acyl-carrier-protein] desaturase
MIYHAEINDKWEIDKISGLTDAEKARDYLMKLPGRMAKYLKD